MANAGKKMGHGANGQHGAKPAGKTDPEQSPDEFDMAPDLKGKNSLQGEDQDRAPSQRQAQAEATGDTQGIMEAISGGDGRDTGAETLHGGDLAHIGDSRARQVPGGSGDGEAFADDAVRRRAYQLWEDEGRPDGQHETHWLRAERELRRGGSDIEDNPGIGSSLGTTGAAPEDIESGENTFEGDVLNDTTGAGGVDPGQRGHTNP